MKNKGRVDDDMLRLRSLTPVYGLNVKYRTPCGFFEKVHAKKCEEFEKQIQISFVLGPVCDRLGLSLGLKEGQTHMVT